MNLNLRDGWYSEGIAELKIWKSHDVNVWNDLITGGVGGWWGAAPSAMKAENLSWATLCEHKGKHRFSSERETKSNSKEATQSTFRSCWLKWLGLSHQWPQLEKTSKQKRMCTLHSTPRHPSATGIENVDVGALIAEIVRKIALPAALRENTDRDCLHSGLVGCVRFAIVGAFARQPSKCR